MDTKIKLDYSLINNIEVDGITSHYDHDLSDAYIASAWYGDRPMTQEELDALNEDSEHVYDLVWHHLH